MTIHDPAPAGTVRDQPNAWGPAAALRHACRQAHTHALDALLDSASAPEALVWVVCEMSWADQDLDDAGVPAPDLSRRGASRFEPDASSVLDLLLSVIESARAARRSERDERVRAASVEAAARAEVCRAVLALDCGVSSHEADGDRQVTHHAQSMGDGGALVRGAVMSRPAS